MAIDNDKSSRLRKKAEEILNQRGIQNQELYKRDLESLVEELSIHQIELEQQNEELKKTQNELEISRNRYSDLFNNAPIGYFIIKKNYRIKDVNNTGGEMLGISRNELKETSFTGYIHPDSQDTFYFHLKEVRRSGQHQSCELKLKPASSDYIYVNIESARIDEPDQNKGNESIRCAVIDITDRKEKEGISRRLSAIVNSSDDAIISVSKDIKIQSWNKGAEEIYGYEADEVTGKTPDFLVPNDRREEIKDYLENVFKGKPIEHFETIRIRKDGKPVNISLSVSPIFNEQNEITGAATISRDITEQKRNEERLRESEAKYRAIFEHSGEGFLLMKDKILDCNKQATRLFSYSKKELIGKDPVKDLSPEKQPHGENSISEGKQYIHKAFEGEIQQFYWKHQTKNGNLIDTEITLNGIDTGSEKYIIAIVHDISDHIEHQRQLKEKNEEIQAQNEEYVTLNEELNEANAKLQETVNELEENKQKLEYSEELLGREVTEVG